MTRLFAFLMMAFLLAPAAGQAAPAQAQLAIWTPPWADLTWNMPWRQIQAAKPAAVLISPPQVVGPLASVWRIPSEPVAGVIFSTTAQVDTSTTLLRQVLMMHAGLVDPVHLDLLRQAITRRYGPPKEVCRTQEAGGAFPTLDILWVSANDKVHLALLNVTKMPFVGTDNIKAAPVWEKRLFSQSLVPQMVAIRAHAEADTALAPTLVCAPAR